MKKIICNKTFDKKQITKLIEWFTYNYGAIRTNNITNKLKYLGFKYATKAGLSLGLEDLKVPTIKKSLIKNTSQEINKKEKKLTYGKITKQMLLQQDIEIWNITNNILKDEIIKNFRQKDLLNPVYMMIFSGARGNISQIKQLIGMRGLMSDSRGDIISSPIKSNLKEGLKTNEYFISCYGARKGIIDTALKTANSGYLTRKLIYVAQNVIIKQQDCGTKKGILLNLSTKKKNKYKNLKGKIVGSIVCENIKNEKGKIIIGKGQDICPYLAKKIIKNESYILCRSVLGCKVNFGLCQLCYGWNFGQNKIVRIGEAVGILAAQSIGEPGTQLTMRTFHTGGIFTSKSNKIITSPFKGKIIYDDKTEGKKIKNKYNEETFILAKRKAVFIKNNVKLVSKIILPNNTKIFLKTNKEVFEKQIIAEITEQKEKKEKETKEIKSESSGKVYFQIKKEKIWVLKGKLNILSLILDTTKIRKKNYLNSKYYRKVKVYKRNYIKINKISYEISKTFKNKTKYNKNQLSHTIIEKTKKLDKVLTSEKENELILKSSKIEKKVKMGRFFIKLKGKLTEIQIDIMKLTKSNAYKIPTNSRLKVTKNQLIEEDTTLCETESKKEKTKDIIEGLPKVEEILEVKKTKEINGTSGNLHKKLEKYFIYYTKLYNNKIATQKSVEKIQRALVKQIEEVYSSQGVTIAEKHISVIVKQITSKVTIKNKGSSNSLEGEILDINKVEKLNNLLKKKIVYQPILMGISKVSLLSSGFLTAACFQETIKTLTKSAVQGKIDWLTGLKENIIFGNLIPIGSGNQLL